MQILFTKSNSLLSRMIRKVTGEPVSHCAIASNGYVVHSNLRGVIIETRDYFEAHSQVVYTVEIEDCMDRVTELLATESHATYDIGALLYLGLRYLIPALPKKNLWQSSGMYLCTEWVTTAVNQKTDSMITPYQLYLTLSNK